MTLVCTVLYSVDLIMLVMGEFTATSNRVPY